MLLTLDNLFTVHPETGELTELNPHQTIIVNYLKNHYRDGVSAVQKTGEIAKTAPLLCYRGIKKEQLQADFSKYKDDSIGTLLSRLFYFGNKARHYKADNRIIQENDYLKDINDTSKKTCTKIFKGIRNLRKSKNQAVIDFIKSNNEFFSFFDDSANSNVFYTGISTNDDVARDYYLQLLHTVGNFGINSDITLLVSTSEEYKIAEYFATHSKDEPYIIISVIRPGIATQFITAPNHERLPILPKTAVFPCQKELSIRGAIFPHNIIAVIELSSNRAIFNPGIFTEENKENNIFKTPLFIEQADFLNNIRTQTNFQRYVYTYDFLQLFENQSLTLS